MSNNNEISKETLTKDDLSRIFIRVQGDDGKWGSFSVDEVSDKQFQMWASSKMEIRGGDGPWPLEERAGFCNVLWQEGSLYMLRKEVVGEDEGENDH